MQTSTFQSFQSFIKLTEDPLVALLFSGAIQMLQKPVSI